MKGNEFGVVVMVGAVVLIMTLIALLDWLGERQEKRMRGSSR